MFALRLADVVAVLVAACAGWDHSTPSYAAPPADGPTPSRYAPPAPDGPSVTPPPPPPAEPEPELRVAIASVHLLADCPDPPEVTGSKPTAAGQVAGDATMRSAQARTGDSACTQSTVQLAVRSELAGELHVDAVRVFDGVGHVIGTATLRRPTWWQAGSSAYLPWDEHVAAGVDLQIGYALGEPELSQASKLAAPRHKTYNDGPFILELDVSIAG